jgi:hypothetical protein
MRWLVLITLLLALLSQLTAGQDTVMRAATRYVPGVTWRAKSVVTGDFTCGGRRQTAILGTSATEIVVAVFLNGTDKRPEVIRSSGRQSNSVTLTTEDLDYELDYTLPGFQRSKTCKGLVLDDGEVDPAHFYWNHESLRFDAWSL